jgi:hypothetical protein
MDRKRLDRPPLRLMQLARDFASNVAHRAAAMVRATTQPAAIVALMLLAAGACAVAGVWMLVGVAWALIAASFVLFGLAAIALRGMTYG